MKFASFTFILVATLVSGCASIGHQKHASITPVRITAVETHVAEGVKSYSDLGIRVSDEANLYAAAYARSMPQNAAERTAQIVIEKINYKSPGWSLLAVDGNYIKGEVFVTDPQSGQRRSSKIVYREYLSYGVTGAVGAAASVMGDVKNIDERLAKGLAEKAMASIYGLKKTPASVKDHMIGPGFTPAIDPERYRHDPLVNEAVELSEADRVKVYRSGTLIHRKVSTDQENSGY